MAGVSISPGDKLWCVPRSGVPEEPREVVVKKVLRRWLVLDDGTRVDRHTMLVQSSDGGLSPAKCWPSQKEAEEHHYRLDLWHELRITLYTTHDPAAEVSIEDMEKAIALLRLKTRKVSRR